MTITRFLSNVRSPFFLSMVCCAALLMAFACGGCNAAKAIGVSKPSASVRNARFTSINPSSAMMAFDVDVLNPYEVPLPLTDVDYKVSSNGKQLVAGNAKLEGTVPARQSKTVTIPAELKYADIRAALVTVAPGSVVPYSAQLGLNANPADTGPLTLNLMNIQGQLPIPAPPSVTLTSVRWGSLGLDKADATLNLHVTNHNEFALALSKLNCGVSFGEVPIATAVASNSTNFSAGGSNELSIPISFSPKTLGTSVFNMLTGRGSQYQLKGQMDFTTPYGPMTLPLQGNGQTIFVH